MKNHKVMPVISWIISAVYIFLAVVLISEGNMSKMVIADIGIAVIWLIIGIIYWKKGEKGV